MTKILELQVTNRPGVLDRVAGLIRRRGWNIVSLTAGDIGGGITQIAIQFEGRDIDPESLGDSLQEMDAVHHWQMLSEERDVLWELLLFSLPGDEPLPPQEEGVREIARRDGLRYWEYTGLPSQVDAFAARLRAQGIPCARSGPLPILGKGGQDNA